MQYFNTVKIPVFAAGADEITALQPQAAPPSNGVYYSDNAWLGDKGTGVPNPVLEVGVVEGIARSVDYNTVMRQCSMFASLFANILSFRNCCTGSNIVKTGVTPYGGSVNSDIGTRILSGEQGMDGHIGALSDIFGLNFLADNEVVTRMIAAAAVTEVKLATDSVTTIKIKNESVTKAKLSSGLVNTGSATQNGITVTLSQTNSSSNRGFVIGISSTKVLNAANSDNAVNAKNLSVVGNTTSNLYLTGIATSSGGGVPRPLYNAPDVYISGGNQVNATNFNVASDARLKKNIRDVGHHQIRALVEGVSVKTFEYRNDKRHETKLGVIAQDIKAANTVLGDLLIEKQEDGYLHLHEDKLIFVLWDYVRQQADEIRKLQREVARLEK